MISVEQARRLIIENTRTLPAVKERLSQAMGLVLAQSIRSPSNYPLYDVSAMDGYALKSSDTRKASTALPVLLKVSGTQNAGDFSMQLIKPGECRRVMTGGAVPPGADTILEREKVLERKNVASFSTPIPKGRNIRYQGEGVQKDQIVLKIGARLHSRAVGFLASLGVSSVQVYPRPRVAILITGNELAEPGKRLRPGQIYNSNQWMLEAALRERGLEPIVSALVPDSPRQLKTWTRKVLRTCDLVLLVGGVSVGDSDFSKSVVESLGVKRLFWRVSQKPGFPLYFGQKRTKLVLGLPGNPASAWVNFHEYVVPCLKKLQGFSNEKSRKAAKLVSDGPNRGFKTLFLKARFKKTETTSEVTLLKGQGSHLLQSLAQSNCLAVVPKGKGRLKKGDELEIHPLDEWES